jgi:signal peptide peptidase SppA
MHKILELLNVPLLMEASRARGFLEGHRLQHALVADKDYRKKISLEGGEKIELLAMSDNGYPVTSNGLAVIQMCGPMFKGYGAYGYADQAVLCNTVMMAANDPSVNGIMLLMDTPGGSVAGTADLGDMVKMAGTLKPVHAYIDDLCASAGMWIASQASAITAGRTAIIGSIGVITTLTDATKYFEAAGIKIVNVTTGDKKDIGDPARKMEDGDIDYVQSRIDTIYDHFVDAIAKARGIRGETVRKMQAALYVGQEAVDAKLVDKIGTFAGAMKDLGKVANTGSKNSLARAMLMLETAAI